MAGDVERSDVNRIGKVDGMTNVWLISPLIGTGARGDAFRPQFSSDYPEVGWSDDTGRPVESLPGLPTAIIILVVCSEEQLASIEENDIYFVIETEVIPDV